MAGKSQYINLQNKKTRGIADIDENKLKDLARITRGLIFASLEASQSGHPGGSSSKVEQLLGLIVSGELAFDYKNPKNTGRDRIVWSAGHCTPLLHGMNALIKKNGDKLLKFRQVGGPQGHVESYEPLADLCTGSSGHGLSGAVGLATVHSSCGLDDIYTYVLMGDAETEEGLTYESRNLANTLGLGNLIVFEDRNHFGIDGDTDEVISSNYIDHWKCLGWNVIEADGHNIMQVIAAIKKAKSFKNKRPTVIISHTIKGKMYGCTENTCDSHGKPETHEGYMEIMKALGFDVKGKSVKNHINKILKQLDKELYDYLKQRLEINKNNIKPERELVGKMRKSLKGRKFKSPTDITRPKKLPKELAFKPGDSMATRKAAGAFLEWLMKQSGFFWAGAADLAGSVNTANAEKVYGIINQKNKHGRGIRYGIAEQNMAMMGSALSQETLPGGFKPASVFGTFAVFANMMINGIRMSLVGNVVNKKAKGFFIALFSHDGPETGEDGPTHQGMYWMATYTALPGIKVYKPMDANDCIEMLFSALEKQEPIALAVSRPGVPVYDKDSALSVNGAYILKDYDDNDKEKLVLAVSGSTVMVNVMEKEKKLKKYNIKIIAVTSPELFLELNKKEQKAILSDDEREQLITIHSGWKGFLRPLMYGKNIENRIISIDNYLESGKADDVYKLAKMTSTDIKDKIIQIIN